MYSVDTDKGLADRLGVLLTDMALVSERLGGNGILAASFTEPIATSRSAESLLIIVSTDLIVGQFC
jgi:hypothetical protein